MKIRKQRKEKIGPVKQKILLLLLGGISLGLAANPRRYFKILKGIHADWKEINQRSLRDAIHSLYSSHLLSQEEHSDGTTTILLTKAGKRLALRYDINNMLMIRPTEWDKQWRIVIFDIPEKMKKVRDAIRFHLKKLGFSELQKSVFVLPFDCAREIEYIIEYYEVRKFIRFIIAHSIDNELDLKEHFELNSH